MTKIQSTLRIWHGSPASLAQFLTKKHMDATPDVIIVFSTKRRGLHVWTYGDLSEDVMAVFGLTQVETIDLGRLQARVA